MIREEVARAAERLYRQAAQDLTDPTIEVALRDCGARRDLEQVVVGILAAEPGSGADLAESILTGAVKGSEGRERQVHALASFRASGRRRLPPELRRFLERARRPSRLGDVLATAILVDDRPALFRIVAQVELAGAPTRQSGKVRARVDDTFGRGSGRRDRLGAWVEEAVIAAFDYLGRSAPDTTVADLERATAVRVYRGGLPWPFVPDLGVPSAFEVEQEGQVHDGSSLGLPVALAVLAALLPHWSRRSAPLCAATGRMLRDGSVEVVGEVAAKAEAVVAADVPFLHPRAGAGGWVSAGFRHRAVGSLEEAANEAFELGGDDVRLFLGLRPAAMYGRDRAHRELMAGWERARSGEPRLVLVSGPAGVGKSGAAAAAVDELTASGVPVAFASSQTTPAVLSRAVQRLVGSHSAEELRREAARYGAGLGAFDPDLFDHLPRHYEREALEVGMDASLRRRASSATAILRRQAGRWGGLVVVLEDVQWASDETWPMLEAIFERSSGAFPLLVIASYRDDPRVAVADETFDRLRGRGVLTDLVLEGLDREALSAWLADAAPSLVREDGDQVDRLIEALFGATDGNPLQVDEWLGAPSTRATTPDAFLAELERAQKQNEEQKAARLRAWVRRHPALPILALGATFRSGEFSVPLLRLAAGDEAADDEMGEMLRAATDDRLITRVGGRYAFHESRRQAVIDVLSAEERARCHRRIAEALEWRALDSGARLPVVELADHFWQALPLGTHDTWRKAVKYASLAGDERLRTVDYDEARTYRLQALAAFEHGDLDIPAEECRLLLDAARACSYAGLEEEARPRFREAAELAHDTGLVDEAVAATLGYAGPPEDKGLTEQELLDLLAQAASLPLPPGDRRRLQLEGRQRFELVMAARREPGALDMPPVVELLERARGSNDDIQMAWALAARLIGQWTIWERPAERLQLTDELFARAVRGGERDLAAWAQAFRVIHLLELGRRDEAEEAVETMDALAADLHHGYARWGAAVLRAVLAHLDGDLDGCRREAGRAAGLRDSATSVIYHHVQRMLTLREEARFDEIEPLLRSLRSRINPSTAWSGFDVGVDAAWASWCCDVGRYDEAAEILERHRQSGLSATGQDPIWMTVVGLLTEVAVALDDPRPVRRLRVLAEEHEGEAIMIGLGIACMGAVDRYLGLLAGMEGDWDGVERHFTRAVEINEAKLRSPLWTAYSRLDHASVLVRRGRREDRAKARELCVAARDGGASIGMRRLLSRADSLLRRLS